MRSEVGTQQFAALLLKHIQIVLCLQHPILKLCTCAWREPQAATKVWLLQQPAHWTEASGTRGLLVNAAIERRAGLLC